MPQPAEAAALTLGSAPRPIRALPVHEVEEPDPHEGVIHRMAADRLRDLRDDGLTLAYIARMYDLPADEMEALAAELVPTRRS